jgi:hypothetical protein
LLDRAEGRRLAGKIDTDTLFRLKESTILTRKETLTKSTSVVYIQEPIDQVAGCMLADATAKDVAVVESYRDVKANLAAT